MGHTKKKTSSAVAGARAVTLALLASTLSLGACGDKKREDTQGAAKVNGDEITVHEINLALQQQRNLRPEQADAVSRQLLEQLIDQQLAIQQAEKLKLDRDPLTVQLIDAARRDILARRYLETVAQSAGKPIPDDVNKYYAAHPALFAQRKIYQFQRIDVPLAPNQREDVAAHLKTLHSVSDATDWLKSKDIDYTVTPMTQPAESLPLQVVDQAATMQKGDSMLLNQQTGLSVLMLDSAEPAPKTLDEARAPIEQFLTIQARRDAVATTTKSLRAGAKIEYEGRFAASAPAPGDAASANDASSGGAASASAPASGGIDSNTLQKGLGLK